VAHLQPESIGVIEPYRSSLAPSIPAMLVISCGMALALPRSEVLAIVICGTAKGQEAR
jgi:hypothetical protein